MTSQVGLSEDADMYKSGTLSTFWVGWGEETMLAGKILQHSLPEGKYNVFWQYTSAWMSAPKNFAVKPLIQSLETNNTENDFFVFNRIASIQRWSQIPFPHDTTPYLTIDTDGYVLAWVFRGSDLEASGDLAKMQPALNRFQR